MSATLVIGGLGMVGARVTARLLAEGHDVVVADLAAVPGAGPVAHEPLDVRDGAALRAILARHRVDRVVLLAARVHDGPSAPRLAFDVNVAATLDVIAAAAEAGARRVVYASSRAIYGEIAGPWPRWSAPRIDEDHPCRPTTLYGVAKLASETFGIALARTAGIGFTALRFGSIFGPPQPGAGDDPIRRLVEAPLHGERVVVRGGDQQDDLVYVEDVARGICLAATADAPAADGRFHVSSGVGSTLRDVADAVRAVEPGTELAVVGGHDPFGFGYDAYAVLDHARATAAFGYRPAYDLRAAVADHLAVVRGAAAGAQGRA